MTEMKREDPAIKSEEKIVVKEEKMVELDKWEVKAKEQGWKPKEEWEGAEEDWRPAREYVERGELFEKIETQDKDLKQVRKVLDTLKTHHLRVKQDSMEEAVKLLKKQRDDAKKEEDLVKVIDLTDQIDDLKDRHTKEIHRAQQELQEPVAPAGPTTQFIEWHKTNQWYKPNGKDSMSTFANVEADRYMFEHKSATQEQMLKYVSERIKEEFSEKFTKAKIDSKVEGAGGSRPIRTTDNTNVVLTESETKIMNTLVNSGTITKEQYLKDIKKYEESHGS